MGKNDDAHANSDLLAAAEKGDVAGVKSALAAGASIEATDDTGRTALLLASLGDHIGVADVLVAAGASADTQDDMLQSAWLVTGVTGSVGMLEALLPAKPDMALRNRYGGVSVIPASERGHVDYVRRVLKEPGMNVNHVNNLGWTALLETVILGNGTQPYQDITRILLENGARPDLADNDGVTPLKHARGRGQDKVAKILEQAGASETPEQRA